MSKTKPGTLVKLTPKLFAVAAYFALLAAPLNSLADTALIKTALGDIKIELLTADAPNTVNNFVKYVQNYKYHKSFMHRSVPGFVIQGGGFTFDGINPVSIFSFDPIDNEFKISNTRGTVAIGIAGNLGHGDGAARI